MRRRDLLCAIAATAAPASRAYAASATSPADILARVDQVRLPGNGEFKLGLRMTVSAPGSSKTYVFSALLREGGARSLIEALDGDQRGQKYLATPDGYWFYAPRTRRAIRMTPLQVIRGQASVGDISRLRFADDYTAEFETPPTADAGGVECHALRLTAKSDRATYRRIRLLVARSTNAPVHAELMAASGRLLKTAEFSPAGAAGAGLFMPSVTYRDGIDPTKQTRVETISREHAHAPALLFQPEALPG